MYKVGAHTLVLVEWTAGMGKSKWTKIKKDETTASGLSTIKRMGGRVKVPGMISEANQIGSFHRCIRRPSHVTALVVATKTKR
jgi:hypothetical protein